MPHWVPSDRKIEAGDVVLIDMGSKYHGYCSDMTRTIFVDNINDEVKKIYDLVFDNQKVAINEVKDGASIKIISRIVEGNLKMNGYEAMHALGHGVGLDIHETPVLSQKSEKYLKENMTIAIEPRSLCYWKIWCEN